MMHNPYRNNDDIERMVDEYLAKKRKGIDDYHLTDDDKLQTAEKVLDGIDITIIENYLRKKKLLKISKNIKKK